MSRYFEGKACTGCRYFWKTREFDRHDGQGLMIRGQCRRLAPAVPYRGSSPREDQVRLWPNVYGDNWCGEWVADGPSSPTEADLEFRRKLHELERND